MKAARLAVLGAALLAAGGAGLLAMKMFNQKPQEVVVQQEAPKIQYEQVLVAVDDIGMGTTIKDNMLTWQNWPKDALGRNFITKSNKPDAMAELTGSLARSPIYQGEPVSGAKLIKSDQGYMSAILPKGQRAVATSISTATSAGGFVLPNDRVDVIMTRRRAGEGETGYEADVVLENVRVLAIDQSVEEKDGTPVVVGETATLQLTPDQVEILAIAQQTADRLSLSLRSIADSGEDAISHPDGLVGGSRGTVRVIRYGAVKETSAPANAAFRATETPEQQ